MQTEMKPLARRALREDQIRFSLICAHPFDLRENSSTRRWRITLMQPAFSPGMERRMRRLVLGRLRLTEVTRAVEGLRYQTAAQGGHFAQALPGDPIGHRFLATLRRSLSML